MIKLDREKVYDFICAMDDAGKMYSNDDGFGFFIKLDAGWLEKVKQNPKLLLNPIAMQLLLRKNGENIHLIGIFGNEGNKGFVSIRRGLRELIAKEKPASISWFNKKLNKFNYRRLRWQEQ